MTKAIPIELANYKGLKAKKRELKVEEKEIDKALDYLRNSRAKIVTVNKSAQKGNRIEIDFEVRLAGVKIENGESKNHPLILGQGRFLPGFENELEGMKAGQEKEFSLKVPADWPDKKISGKNLDFKVKMNIVQERELSEINDEFAKALGSFSSLGDLKQSVKDGLMQEKETMEKQRIRIELIEKIAADSKTEVPESLINEELEIMMNELKASIGQLGLDFEKYLSEIKTSVDNLKKSWKEQAEKRVKIGLCLKAIADKEKISVSEEEVEQRVNEDLKYYGSTEQVKKDIDLSALKEYTKNILINEKVFALLEREAEII